MTRWRRLVRWVVIPAALFLVGWLWKLWFIDLYLVVEQSMWPGFAGDSDRILVKRLARRPDRWEIWLYEGEVEDEGPFVKRVIALEGEFLDLRLGDLWLGASPEPESMKRLRRPPEVVDAMLVPVYPTPSGARGEGRFNVRPGSLKEHGAGLRLVGVTRAALKSGLGPTSRENIHDDYLGNDGQFHTGAHVVPDVRVDFVVAELTDGARLRVEHRLRGQAEHRALIIGNGTLRLSIGGPERARFERLPWDGTFPLGLRMETLDGNFRIVGFSPESGENGPVLLEEPRDTEGHHGESRVFLDLDRGSAVLSHFAVARDVFWAWPSRRQNAGAYHVGRGVFMLGDNAPVSEDSRETGPVSTRRLIGRAWRIVWPRDRARILP